MDKKTVVNQIKSRILAEHRKHKTLDWANIAAHKIWSDLFEEIEFSRIVEEVKTREDENNV